MRIRSIKPEFWRSPDVTSLPIAHRFLFIGLWSYVDDNGVGKDEMASVIGDLFAEDMLRDSRETVARVSEGLSLLSERGLIRRYSVDSRAYLFIVKWEKHQRIDKPAKPRFPRPDGDLPVDVSPFATPSRDSRDTLAPGTGEQGNRGTDKRHVQGKPALASEFASFWTLYPRKQGKADALKAFTAARKKTPAKTIIDGAQAYALLNIGEDKSFLKLPGGWIRGERWEDEQIVNATKHTTTEQPTECPFHKGYPLPCLRCAEEGREF